MGNTLNHQGAHAKLINQISEVVPEGASKFVYDNYWLLELLALKGVQGLLTGEKPVDHRDAQVRLISQISNLLPEHASKFVYENYWTIELMALRGVTGLDINN